MTVFFVSMVVIINFIVLNIFSGCLLYYYHKRNARTKDHFADTIDKEKQHLEELSHELISVSEVLLARIEKKEKEFSRLIEVYKKGQRPPLGMKLILPEEMPREGAVVTKKIHVADNKIAPEEYLQEDSKYKEIYYLADKGHGIVDIARKANKPKGEIELILSLRHKRAVIASDASIG